MTGGRLPSVTLGRTGLVTSKLSLGTWGWGGPSDRPKST